MGGEYYGGGECSIDYLRDLCVYEEDIGDSSE